MAFSVGTKSDLVLQFKGDKQLQVVALKLQGATSSEAFCEIVGTAVGARTLETQSNELPVLNVLDDDYLIWTAVWKLICNPRGYNTILTWVSSVVGTNSILM